MTRWKVVTYNAGGSAEFDAVVTDVIDHPVTIASMLSPVFASQIVADHNAHDALCEALAAVARLTRFELPELNNTDQWKRNLIDIDHIVQSALRQAGR